MCFLKPQLRNSSIHLFTLLINIIWPCTKGKKDLFRLEPSAACRCSLSVLHLHRFTGVTNFRKVPMNFCEEWPILRDGRGRSRSTFVTVLESCAICKFETGDKRWEVHTFTNLSLSLSLSLKRGQMQVGRFWHRSRPTERQTDRLERPCVRRDARQVTAEEQAIKLMMVCPSQSALCRLCGPRSIS